MADGVVMNAGSGGSTAATDDCGAAGHAQVVKLAIATDGSATHIPADATAGLLVDISDDATRDNGIVDIGAALPAGNNNIGDVDVASVNGFPAQDAAVAGNPLLVGGRASAAAPTDMSADGDSVYLWTTLKGALNVADAGGSITVDQGTAANLNCTEASAATIATNTGNAATSLGVIDDWDNGASDGASVSGDVAHDTADAGEPVKIGARAETAPSGVTAVADGDRTNLYAGADGILYVRPYCALEDILSGVDTDTDGSSTSVISAPGAGIRLYITSVIVKNTHASTDAYVDIRDGTAGTVLASVPAPAAGGAVVSFPVPLRLTANTACAVDPSAAVSTIITTVVGFKAAV